MSNRKISEDTLLEAEDIDGATDYVPVVDPSEASAGSRNKRSLLNTIADWILTTYAGFVQSGSAQPRNTQSKNRERLDLTDFCSDAKKTAIANDTGAEISEELEDAWTEAAGRPVILPYGRLIMETGKTYTGSASGPGLTLIGQGMGRTKFENRVANGPMLYLDGGVTSAHDLGAKLEGFSVIETTNPAASIGLQFRGQWFLKLRRIIVNSMSSDGLKFINDVSDPDASAYFDMDQVYSLNNGGWGLNMPNPSTTAIANALYSVARSQFTSNTSGGARLLGAVASVKLSGFASNGGPGIVLPYDATAASPQSIDIELCEFDGNTTYHIDVQAGVHPSIRMSKFVYGGNLTGIRLGNGVDGEVLHAICERNHHRRDSGTVTVHSVGANASSTKIRANHYPSLTGVTKLSDSGVLTEHEEGGQILVDSMLTGGAAVANGATYTPDAKAFKRHRIVVQGATFTVGEPTGGADGRELFLEILNGSGSATTGSFNAAFQNAGYTNPGAGESTTAHFIYTAASGTWKLQGAWSAAF